MINNYISYFTDCYRADNREFTIANIFSTKFECQYIIKGEEELINDVYPIQYLPEKAANSILQSLAMFKNDKELLYGSLFCLGKRKSFGKRKTSIVAPLFYYKASIVEKEGDYFIQLDSNSRALNIGFLKTLVYITSFNEFYSELEELLSVYLTVDFGFISVFKRLLDKHVENLTEDLLLFPKLKTQSFVKKELTKITEEEQFKLVSASGVFISSKANNINGVVNELALLKKATSYSTAIQQFFSEELEEKKAKLMPNKIQVLLNTAQEQVVKNAFQYNKSVIIGPPGTGKTYTISAIAQDYVSQGKSVLIVTKTSQALDVIQDKLQDFQLSKFIVKVGGKYYKRGIRSHLNKIANGYFYKYYQSENFNNLQITKKALNKKLLKFEESFSEKIKAEKERVNKINSNNAFTRVVNELDIKWWRKTEEEEWNLIDNFFKDLNRFEKVSDDCLFYSLVNRLDSFFNDGRIELIKLINTFSSLEKAEKAQALQEVNAKYLVDALPIWLVKIDEVSEGLPMEKELFDLVIVDEATQCDIASCLPIFQRAKKVVVAGDTNQLRHISFLATAQLNSFQKKHQLSLDGRFNYRKKSLLDFTLELTPSNEQVVLLDEHYRSLPDIISFSNKMFYNEALRVMTATPKNKGKQSVFVEQINGEHAENGINEKEAIAVLKKVKQIIESEKDLSDKQATSIGVLSPFRNQTDYLANKIKNELDVKTINKHNVRLGTPYHFQGEERDVMLLSMVVDNHSHPASLHHLNKDDVFNVAITRARHKQLVYLSIDKQAIKPESLLRRYIENTLDVPEAVNVAYHDEFSEAVTHYLEHIGCHVHVAYSIAGLTLDLLVEYKGKYIGIDLIGYPGDFEEAFSIERYKILSRVGISVFPISYISWEYQREELKGKLKSRIHRGYFD